MENLIEYWSEDREDEGWRPFNLESIPRYDKFKKSSDGQTRLLYHLDFWDGPITGVLLWNGERCYFKMSADIHTREPWSQEEIDKYESTKETNPHYIDDKDYYEYDGFRQYAVYRVTPDTMAAIDYNHELFRTHVGTHTDYNEDDGKRAVGSGVKPRSEHHKWYDHPEVRKKHNLEAELIPENIIGYFER